MVVLAASICTKGGKAVISRQFVEMARSRIEGLLASFPKLITAGNQHTYVENEAVRYIYQPLEDLYLVLITNKYSNILQDIDTLHLFARTVSEYCRSLKESEILHNAYDLIYAFDEIVALGYRENVNVAQIRTFTEMYSNEEQLQEVLQKNKERDAKENAKLKAKQLDVQRREQAKKNALNTVQSGWNTIRASGSGAGAVNMGGVSSAAAVASHMTRPLLGSSNTSPFGSQNLDTQSTVGSAPKRGMQLGSKPKNSEVFDAIRTDEGIDDSMMNVPSQLSPLNQNAAVMAPAAQVLPKSHQSPVHAAIEEKFIAVLNRDGGLENLEVKGEFTLRIVDPNAGRIRLALSASSDSNIQYKTHPHVDKAAWSAQSVIATKDAAKAFPVNQPVPVLKWRYTSKDESMVPIAVNFWPTPGSDGSLDCSVEYELIPQKFELRNVLISIPLPANTAPPKIEDVDGNYTLTGRSLDWRIPVIDKDNSSGTLEFHVTVEDPALLFPVRIQFSSAQSFCDVAVREVSLVEGGSSVPFAQDISLVTENFQIV